MPSLSSGLSPPPQGPSRFNYTSVERVVSIGYYIQLLYMLTDLQ